MTPDPNPSRTMENLPDAFELLFDRGTRRCVQRFPELAAHQTLLHQLRWAERQLTDREVEMEDAAQQLQQLERELVQQLEECGSLQRYSPPRLSLVSLLWSWISWQQRRMRSLLSTTTPPPYRSTIFDSSLRWPELAAGPPIGSSKTRLLSTTPASPEPSTPSAPSTAPADPALDC